MKYFVVFVIVCATIGLSEQGMSKEQMIEAFKKVASDCASKEGASASDIDEAFAHVLPTTKAGKCMRYCVGESIGLVKGNSINIEGHEAMAKVIYGGDDAKIQAAIEIAKECSAVADNIPDRCEGAFTFLQCYQNAEKARGINLHVA